MILKSLNKGTKRNDVEINNLAPIVIFTYRRKIDKLIESLLKNELSKESELYIFSDGYRNDVDKEDVLEVRESLKSITGFKSIIINEFNKNHGLANSVISGVSKIIVLHENIIVLEDDLLVAENFLKYMNDALIFYKDDTTIWSISGYTPKLECLENYGKDLFLSPRASSWGWATWTDRWSKNDWDISDWEEFKENKEAIKRFNLGGNDMFKMLETQMLGKIDSWAIRWCYNQFQYNSYTVYPTQSKLLNEGFDCKGTHNSSGSKRWDTEVSNDSIVFENLVVNEKIVHCFQKKYNLQLKTKIGYFLKQYGGYVLAKKMMRFIS
jgi:hypothetical protein